MEEKLIKKNNKVLILGIALLAITLIGSTYAFFTYQKSSQAFTLTSNKIKATFSSGSNQINLLNAYPISDSYALNNLTNLGYVDFTVSGQNNNTGQAITYEIYLTEEAGNTLDSRFVKLYLTDDNGVEVVAPVKFSALGYTTYSKDAANGKLILKNSIQGTFEKKYRLYTWLDSTYSDNTVKEFGFKVNLYAYNEN